MAHKLESAHIPFGLVTIPVGIYLPSMSKIFTLTSCMSPAEAGLSSSGSVRCATATSPMMNSSRGMKLRRSSMSVSARTNWIH